MPQGETFWNPYRMIPIREGIRRSNPYTDEKWRGKSGTITCTIENLTLLFIGVGKDDPQHERFFKKNGVFTIPGSSLKGMLRSLSEIAGGGCFATNHKGSGKNYSNLPIEVYRACSDNRNLCIACRMFGMIGSGQGARIHKGNVHISDAILIHEPAANQREVSCEVMMMNHGAKHVSFYKNPHTKRLDGLCRKMYFHQPKQAESVPPINDNLRKKNSDKMQRIFALAPGHQFEFQIQFSNLAADEYNMLVYALALEDKVNVHIGEQRIPLEGPMRHKIGFAKPLGMGSCYIKIMEINYLDNPEKRFSTLSSGTTAQVFKDAELINEINRASAQYRGDQCLTMQTLRKMMVWDTRDGREFHYPLFDWFSNPINSGKELKTI